MGIDLMVSVRPDQGVVWVQAPSLPEAFKAAAARVPAPVLRLSEDPGHKLVPLHGDRVISDVP